MNETLSEQSRTDLVKYRLERAEEAIQEAELMAGASHFNAAINRLYYACFYAISALLVGNGISASTHAGVKAMFGLHFVSKGIIPFEHGKTFSRLFEIRHSGDYDDFVYCDQELYDDFVPKAKSLIASIQKIVDQKGSNIPV